MQTNLAASGITFDAAAAKTAAESKDYRKRSTLQDLGISESAVDSSISQAQTEVVLPVVRQRFHTAISH